MIKIWLCKIADKYDCYCSLIKDCNAGIIPKYYIISGQDRSVVPEVQQEMIRQTATVKTALLDCGHFPQIVMPKNLADQILDFID